MELNSEQIIKALELHSQKLKPCLVDCPYGGLHFCGSEMAKDALDLINSQEQRIKELTEENDKLYRLLDDKIQENKKLTEENERLTLEYAGFEAGAKAGIKVVRADTVRKMQERLDKHFCHDPAFLGVEQRLIMAAIDQIAKEMLEGETNGDK